MNPKVSWTTLKELLVRKPHLGLQYLSTPSYYHVTVVDGPVFITCTIQKSDPASANQAEFESSFLSQAARPTTVEVVNQMEKNDKDLKAMCMFAITDEDGIATVECPVPAGGRYIAYGDAEFENRHFFDRVIGIEVCDKDRLIASQIGGALGAGTLDDASMRALPSVVGSALGLGRDATPAEMDAQFGAGNWDFPAYPTLKTYHEDSFPASPESFAGGPPQWSSGMSMTFKYATTEVSPIGGYGYLPGGFWIKITCKKGERAVGAERVGVGLAVSIDWAAPSVV